MHHSNLNFHAKAVRNVSFQAPDFFQLYDHMLSALKRLLEGYFKCFLNGKLAWKTERIISQVG